MEIGGAIKELPPSARPRSRYAFIWAAVQAANGDWLPVICGSAAERKALQCACGGISRWGKWPRMQSVSDIASLTLYIRLTKPTALA